MSDFYDDDFAFDDGSDFDDDFAFDDDDDFGFDDGDDFGFDDDDFALDDYDDFSDGGDFGFDDSDEFDYIDDLDDDPPIPITGRQAIAQVLITRLKLLPYIILAILVSVTSGLIAMLIAPASWFGIIVLIALQGGVAFVFWMRDEIGIASVYYALTSYSYLCAAYLSDDVAIAFMPLFSIPTVILILLIIQGLFILGEYLSDWRFDIKSSVYSRINRVSTRTQVRYWGYISLIIFRYSLTAVVFTLTTFLFLQLPISLINILLAAMMLPFIGIQWGEVEYHLTRYRYSLAAGWTIIACVPIVMIADMIDQYSLAFLPIVLMLITALRYPSQVFISYGQENLPQALRWFKRALMNLGLNETSDTKTQRERPQQEPVKQNPLALAKAIKARRASSNRRGFIKRSRPTSNNYADLATRIQRKIENELLANPINTDDRDRIRQTTQELFNTILAEESMVLSRAERQRLFETMVQEIFGFGPLEVFLSDEAIFEIFVNGPKSIFIRRKWQMTRTAQVFRDDDHLLKHLGRMFVNQRHQLDDDHPIASGILIDGSHVHAVIRPISLVGPSLVIELGRPIWSLEIQDLIRFGTLTVEVATFLRYVLLHGANILICGGIHSQKEVLLNVLLKLGSDTRRIVGISAFGTRIISINEDFINMRATTPEQINPVDPQTYINIALKHQADLLVLGPQIGAEYFIVSPDYDQYNGDIIGVFDAGSASDLLQRLEILALGKVTPGIPMQQIHERIKQRVDIIVHIDRLPDNSHKVMQIVELTGISDSGMMMQTIYEYLGQSHMKP